MAVTPPGRADAAEPGPWQPADGPHPASEGKQSGRRIPLPVLVSVHPGLGKAPPRALLLSGASLGAAVLASTVRPETLEQFWGYIWILALIPAFLFSYYRGWQGATAALAFGMVALTGSELGTRWLFEERVNWWIYGTATVALITVTLGTGVTAELLHRTGGDPLGARKERARRRELARAIREMEMVLYYQPIFSLETGEVSAVEALVRWRHPDRDVLLPEAFLPFAEESGLIVPLGHWVLEQACAQHKRWQERVGRPDTPLRLSLNFSSQQCDDPELVGRLEEVLDSHGLRPDLLQVEMTEGTFFDAAERIQELHDLGVGLIVDDFGKGYSSLAYLSRLQVDGLKIDRSFVMTMDRNERDEKVVRTVASIADSFGLSATAEGIENREQLRRVREMGYEYGQGHLLCRPVPDAESVAETDFVWAS